MINISGGVDAFFSLRLVTSNFWLLFGRTQRAVDRFEPSNESERQKRNKLLERGKRHLHIVMVIFFGFIAEQLEFASFTSQSDELQDDIGR